MDGTDSGRSRGVCHRDCGGTHATLRNCFHKHNWKTEEWGWGPCTQARGSHRELVSRLRGRGCVWWSSLQTLQVSCRRHALCSGRGKMVFALA